MKTAQTVGQVLGSAAAATSWHPPFAVYCTSQDSSIGSTHPVRKRRLQAHGIKLEPPTMPFQHLTSMMHMLSFVLAALLIGRGDAAPLESSSPSTYAVSSVLATGTAVASSVLATETAVAPWSHPQSCRRALSSYRPHRSPPIPGSCRRCSSREVPLLLPGSPLGVQLLRLVLPRVARRPQLASPLVALTPRPGLLLVVPPLRASESVWPPPPCTPPVALPPLLSSFRDLLSSPAFSPDSLTPSPTPRRSRAALSPAVRSRASHRRACPSTTHTTATSRRR
ncbi:hypothetical protein C8Q77DRAFT_927110 [Trametes polyzona]|nr:hypothetical protein C8Q77DRAFT_927110 [Trametes polyzona]